MLYDDEDVVLDTFDWNIGLQPLVFLALSAPIYLALFFFFEYHWKARKQAIE
jgi:hypothetical protein